MILTLRWGEIVTGEEEECLSWKKANENNGARAHPCECTGGSRYWEGSSSRAKVKSVNGKAGQDGTVTALKAMLRSLHFYSVIT